MAEAGSGRKTAKRGGSRAGSVGTGGARAGEPPVTIDLTADEVLEATPKAAPAAKKSPTRRKSPTLKKTSTPGQSSTPRPTRETTDTGMGTDPGADVGEAGRPTEPVGPAPEPEPERGSPVRGWVMSGVIGGAVVLVVGLMAQFAGFGPSPGRSVVGVAGERTEAAHTRLDAQEAASADLRTMIAALTIAVEEISDRTGDVASLTALTALAAEVAALGADLAAKLPAVELESNLTGLSAAMGDLEARLQQAEAARQAASPDAADAGLAMADLSERMSELEAGLSTLAGAVWAPAGSASDRATGALAMLTLERESGGSGPFVLALDAVASLGFADQAVLELRPFSVSGVPTRNELRASFADVAAAMAPTAVPDSQKEGGPLGWFNRAMDGIVTVRPIDQTSTGDASGPWSGMILAVAADDLAGALEHRAGLSAETQNASADWAREVRMRLRTDTLVARITAEFTALVDK